jgi:hypothetical protein
VLLRTLQAPHLALPLGDAFSASGAIAAALDCATLPWRLRLPPPAGPLGQPTGAAHRSAIDTSHAPAKRTLHGGTWLLCSQYCSC